MTSGSGSGGTGTGGSGSGGAGTGGSGSGGGTGGGTSPTPTSTNTFSVTKPLMGDILRTDKDTYVAVVGGKPKADWTGLEKTMDLKNIDPDQH